MDTSVKLTDKQVATLMTGAKRDDGMVLVGDLLGAVRANMARALLAKGAVECRDDLGIVGLDDGVAWGTDDAGSYGYRVTRAGFVALGIDESEWPAYLVGPAGVAVVGDFIATTTTAEGGDADEPAGTPMRKRGRAATAPVAAPVAAKPARGKKATPVIPAPATDADKLGAALSAMTAPKSAAKAPKAAGAESADNTWPRAGSKLATIVAMLKSPTGATAQAIADAVGWKVQNATSVIIGLRSRRGFPLTSDGKGTDRVYRIAA